MVTHHCDNHHDPNHTDKKSTSAGIWIFPLYNNKNRPYNMKHLPEAKIIPIKSLNEEDELFDSNCQKHNDHQIPCLGILNIHSLLIQARELNGVCQTLAVRILYHHFFCFPNLGSFRNQCLFVAGYSRRLSSYL